MNASDNYEKNMDNSSSWSSSFLDPSTERKIELPIFSICFVVGLAGNLLVIYAVVKSKRLHNAPCLLLANLAVADLITIVVLIPLLLTLNLVVDTREWSLGAAICRLTSYILITPPVCSIFTMIAISIERYYVVLHPLKAKSFVTMGRVKKVIIGIWITSCVLTIPSLFDRKLHTFHYEGEGLQEETYVYCWNAWSNRRFLIAYNVYFFLLVFFIPLIIVSYIYIRIGFHLNRTRTGVGNSKDLPVYKVAYRDSSGWSSGSRMTNRTPDFTSEEETAETDTLRSVPNKAEDLNDSSVPRRHRTSSEGDNIQRVIRVLAVVVALFILTWGPLMTYVLIYLFIPNRYYFSYLLTPFLNLLAACNSCVNPIVYAFLSRTFRQSFKEVIRECCCCSPLRKSTG